MCERKVSCILAVAWPGFDAKFGVLILCAQSCMTVVACRECMDLLLELDRPVRYIVLTTHAYEHKVFVPSFQRRFPLAQVYNSPKCALSQVLS